MKDKYLFGHFCFKILRRRFRKRLIFVRIAVLILLVGNSTATAQPSDHRLTLRLHDKTLVETIDAIERRSPYRFYYNSRLLDLSRRVSLEADNEKISAVLERLFKPFGIAYRINGTDVILTVQAKTTGRKTTATSIEGHVRSKQGEPLVGATVLLVGSDRGTTTDAEGHYTLTGTAPLRLRFSYLGYVSKEVKVDPTATTLDIVLEEDINKMEDVVVIGYGTLEKRAVTSSITSLNSKNFIVGAGGSTIATALRGKISGMTITETASPNATNSFQLRGVASINATQSPLIVIDGLPGGDIRSLNQEDIHSIDVLKDASAGAIYGTRAAGGVILVTTKKANEGPMKLTYTGELSFEQVRRRPQVLGRERFLKYGLGSDMGADTDWYDELLNEGALSQRHVVNLSGGSRNARIYATFMAQDQKGIAIGDNRTDYSGRINGNFRLLDDKIEIALHTEYRQAKRDERATSSDFNMALKLNPTLSPYDPSSESGYNVLTGGTDYFNPVADIMLRQNEGIDKWLSADATVKLNLPAGFSAQATVGWQDRQWQNWQHTSEFHKESLDNGRRGRAYHGFDKTLDASFESTVNFNRVFAGDHAVDAVIGYSFWERNGERFNMTNYDFPVDGVGAWDIGNGSWLSDGKADMSSYKAPRERLIAFFGRANYSYRDKYIITGSLRHEGSSKFGRNHRWGNFWAVSGGWRLSKEVFLEDADFLDDLKLRVGYGITGNNGFSAGKSTRMYAANSWWIYDGEWIVSYGSARNVNYDLHWEEKAELNIGLDYSFFGNRLFGKFDIYKRKVSGMIYDIAVPNPPAVHSKTTMNYGNLENRGWEFEIGGTPVQSEKFHWTTSLRVSRNRSKITSLWGNNTYQDRVSFPAPGTPGSGGRLEEGTEIGSFYIWKYAGITDDGRWLIYDKNDNIVLADKKTYEDKRYIGNSIPAVILSWDHTLTYRNWSLGVNLRSWIDYDVFNTIDMYYGLSTVTNQNVLRNAFIDNRHIKQEKLLCDYWLEDGTFLKIDAITLGYNLDMKKYQKYIDRINLYFTVRDVACFTNYTGLDPEVNINGLDPGYEWFTDIYPKTRRYTFGIQFVF